MRDNETVSTGLTRSERDGIRLITSWPATLFFGLGIPGLIGTGTILDLASKDVRGPLTWWLYWIMVAAAALAAIFAVACRMSVTKPDRWRLTKYLFVACVASVLLVLACSTTCLVLQQR